MPVSGKRHYHRVVAYETKGRTPRGNPETYIFTLECGHTKREFHSARIMMITFSISVIIPDMIKKRQILEREDFPRMHCRECARGRPHTEDATDLDKLIENINKAVKEAVE